MMKRFKCFAARTIRACDTMSLIKMKVERGKDKSYLGMSQLIFQRCRMCSKTEWPLLYTYNSIHWVNFLMLNRMALPSRHEILAEAEYATSRARSIPTILNLYDAGPTLTQYLVNLFCAGTDFRRQNLFMMISN